MHYEALGDSRVEKKMVEYATAVMLPKTNTVLPLFIKISHLAQLLYKGQMLALHMVWYQVMAPPPQTR